MVDIRIIAATHRNLEEMIRSERFREDLWFRLNVFPIMIPPIRRLETPTKTQSEVLSALGHRIDDSGVLHFTDS